MCVLGMGDGVFPRTENRPAYDFLRQQRKMGDRSPAIEDRLAWLEALMNARDRLLIFYPAFSPADGQQSCESVVVRELIEQLTMQGEKNAIQIVPHHLQAFHPYYFVAASADQGLFSYSTRNCEAARRWVTGQKPQTESAAAGAGGADPARRPREIALADLVRFFKNPAKFRCEEVLGLRRELSDDTTLADSEVFDPNHLEEYAIRQAVIEAMVPGPGNEAIVQSELTATGLLPLAAWGERWFHGAWQDLEGLLNTSWAALAGTLKAALAVRDACPTRERVAEVTLDGTSIRITGTVPIMGHGDHGTILTFRAASPKPITRLESWLTHLFACAAERKVTSVVIQGKTADPSQKGTVQGLKSEPVASSDEAKTQLAEYVRVYLEGLDRFIEFTPNAALAYVEPPSPQAKKKKSPLQKAREEWFSKPRSPAYDGDRDVYFLYAFGPGGPFGDEAAFERLARAVMEPLVGGQCEIEPGGV